MRNRFEQSIPSEGVSNRRVVNSGGQQESEEERLNRQNLGAKEVEKYPLDPEIREQLTDFDFLLLRTILEEYYKKSNLDPKRLQPIPLERISGRVTSWSGAMSHDPVRGIIKTNKERLYATATKFKLQIKALLEYLLIHEEIHAISRISIEGSATDMEQPVIQRGGFDKFERYRAGEGEDTYIQSRESYTLFEEGMTDKLALEVYGKYCAAKGLKGGEYENIVKFIRENPGSPYRDAITFIDIFIKRLAAESGTSEELVWGGLVRGKLEGTDLDDKEFEQLFSEMFSDRFLSLLAKDNFAELEKELKEKPSAEQAKPKRSLTSLLSRLFLRK